MIGVVSMASSLCIDASELRVNGDVLVSRPQGIEVSALPAASRDPSGIGWHMRWAESEL